MEELVPICEYTLNSETLFSELGSSEQVSIDSDFVPGSAIEDNNTSNDNLLSSFYENDFWFYVESIDSYLLCVSGEEW